MFDSAFAYEPHPEFGGECETEQDLIRERFRLLWNVWVAGRMQRNDWSLPDAENRSRRGRDQAFASWEPRRREAVFQDLGSRDRCTQRELLELAKDERLTQMLGAGGVRCPLCHFPTRDGVRAWDGEWAPVTQAIQADYPDWTPAQGACVGGEDDEGRRHHACGQSARVSAIGAEASPWRDTSCHGLRDGAGGDECG